MDEMKCIYTENKYISNNIVRSELWTETRKGNSAPLLPDRKRNPSKLSVTTKGFMLTNAHGEVLREGKATDVFEVYDSMIFQVDPLEVETEDFTGTEESSGNS